MFALMACSVYPNLIEGIGYVLHKSIPKLKSIYRKIIYFALMVTEKNRKKNRKSRGFI